ncbi:PREDICTED: voltage-dependent calcium channel subunit alpha-2/delta-1-like [Tinamus guttatus]|nr:PREDICTED: voltage-dependent calcium channel subunit alpha-2/delta-1-like [Tinamus guttatus]
MAAGWLLVFSLTLFQSLVLNLSSEGPFPSATTIKSWVDKMQEDLVTLARTASGVDRLAAIYLQNKDLYTVEANNPRQLVEIAARDIEKLLSNRSKALVGQESRPLDVSHPPSVMRSCGKPLALHLLLFVTIPPLSPATTALGMVAAPQLARPVPATVNVWQLPGHLAVCSFTSQKVMNQKMGIAFARLDRRQRCLILTCLTIMEVSETQRDKVVWKLQ